jgi:adenylosuccinate synthase
LRVGDIEAADFKKRYHVLKDKHQQLLAHYNYSGDVSEFEKEWFGGIELLQSLTLIDSEHLLNNYNRENKKILAEGAQGSLLDIDFGSYPFVTSSNTITAGTCTGLGIPPGSIHEVFGIFKAYCTRVGSGPFPTELNDEVGEKMRKIGNEYGATTGRARRCGWLDIPALKYAVMINGVTQLIMTKPDVLSGYEILKVCTHYKMNGKTIDYMPYDIVHNLVEPVYKEIKGWQEDLTAIRSPGELPFAFNEYISFIEQEIGVPVTIVSVGPDRDQVIMRKSLAEA